MRIDTEPRRLPVTSDQALAAVADLAARGLPPTIDYLAQTLRCRVRTALTLRQKLIAEGRLVLPPGLAARSRPTAPLPPPPAPEPPSHATTLDRRLRRNAAERLRTARKPLCATCHVWHVPTVGAICGRCQDERRKQDPAGLQSLAAEVTASLLSHRLRTRRFAATTENVPLLPILNAAEAARILPRTGRAIRLMCWREITSKPPPAAPRGLAPR